MNFVSSVFSNKTSSSLLISSATLFLVVGEHFPYRTDTIEKKLEIFVISTRHNVFNFSRSREEADVKQIHELFEVFNFLPDFRFERFE